MASTYIDLSYGSSGITPIAPMIFPPTAVIVPSSQFAAMEMKSNDIDIWAQDCSEYAIDHTCSDTTCQLQHQRTLNQALNLEKPFGTLPAAISFFQSVRTRFLAFRSKDYTTRIDERCAILQRLDHITNVKLPQLIKLDHANSLSKMYQRSRDMLYDSIGQDESRQCRHFPDDAKTDKTAEVYLKLSVLSTAVLHWLFDSLW